MVVGNQCSEVGLARLHSITKKAIITQIDLLYLKKVQFSPFVKYATELLIINYQFISIMNLIWIIINTQGKKKKSFLDSTGCGLFSLLKKRAKWVYISAQIELK